MNKVNSTLQRFVMTCTGLVFIAGCASPGAYPVKNLAIGVQATKPEETRAAWSPLVADIGKKLKAETTLVAASQADIVKALRGGRVDVVWLSSAAAIDAVTRADGETFALYVNVNGTNGYKGIIITRADSGIATLEQAMTPGKYSYASGAKTSTSGYVLPQHFLFNKLNTTPEATFKSVTYGGHFDNLAALWARKVDVSVNNSTDTAVFQETREPASKGNIRVLWESPLVPNDVLMFRKNTPEGTKAALREFFLKTYGQTEEEKVLYRSASGIKNFVPADNRVLESVAEVKFATELASIEFGSALSDAQKAVALKTLKSEVNTFKKSLPPTK